jgi:Ni,Fe-hydrogenase I small subunit
MYLLFRIRHPLTKDVVFSMLSLDYDDTLMAAAGQRGWHILILNFIKVVGMPEVALAADEDFADTIECLLEYLDMMVEPV